jgi:hypothetical protein
MLKKEGSITDLAVFLAVYLKIKNTKPLFNRAYRGLLDALPRHKA